MTYPIEGIKEGLGPGEQVPVRREIDEWWFSPDANDLNQRSLFIYALHQFMSMIPKPEDPKDLSYYSIAGIHGQPLKPWDAKDGKPNDGYCAHFKELFPTWHRPYLLLYEQRLYNIMLDLIKGKTFAEADKPAMYQAAKTWRLPFWDWAMKKPDWDPTKTDSLKDHGDNVGPNVPFLLTQEYVEVKTATGTTSVPNPMLKFSIPKDPRNPKKQSFKDYDIPESDDTNATSRRPSTYDPKHPNYVDSWVKGNEMNWRAIEGELRGHREILANTLPESVYRLFSNYPSYPQFASASWREGLPPERYSSLEAVHGDVHNLVGGNGQMGTIAVAAFDPIFWMHHCNIDRLLALWQDLFDEKYAEWLRTTERFKEGSGWPLNPFHMDSTGTPWNSIKCSFQQKDLGYTYPELKKWLDIYKANGVFDKEKFKKLLRADIEKKYSSTGKSALQLPENDRIATTHMAAMTKQNLAIENFPPALVEKATQASGTVPQSANPPSASWEQNDYIVNVVYNRFALGGHPYVVRIFLGDVPQDPPYYFEETPTEVGLVYNFSSPANGRETGAEGCENCNAQEEEGALGSGQAILTDYLVENITKQREQRGITLTSLSRAEVVEYLKTNLHWRISDKNDNIVPKENMPSLKISVVTSKITHYAEASRFSEYGDYEVLWAVTEGRLAGANPGDLGLPS